MFSIPNFISILRVPLAFVFVQANPYYRLMAIVAAMISDFLDGYLARRCRQINQLGTLIDPLADKFFVVFVLLTFIREHRIEFWEAGLFLCRDLAIILYGLYLVYRRRLATYKIRAIWCGKITTVLQFMILIGLTLLYEIPSFFYSAFVILGVMSLGELYLTDRFRGQPTGV